MTNKQIAYFKKTYELKNMQTVSEVLYVSRPAISYAIAEIEEEFGTELFIRTSSGVEPTTAGHLLYEHVINSERQYKYLVQKMQDTDSKRVNRTIKIGISPTNDVKFIPLIFDKYHALYPDVHIEVKETPAESIPSIVNEGLVDVAITPGTVDRYSDIDHLDLYEVFMMIAINEKNPLADKTILTAKDILELPFVFLGELPASLTVALTTLFSAYGKQVKTAASLSEKSLIRYMVEKNHAAALLPSDITSDWTGVKNIPLMGLDYMCTQKLIWSKHQAQNPIAGEFIRFIRDEFKIGQ